ncbi:MAG: hypothetical protein KJ077_08250 [Anaerolineae bacterium]|nr:hypothetical protein [Anaerolineae bacterium]
MKLITVIFISLLLLSSCEQQIEKIERFMKQYRIEMPSTLPAFLSPVPTPFPIPTSTCNPNCPTAEPTEVYSPPPPRPNPPTVEPAE